MTIEQLRPCGQCGKGVLSVSFAGPGTVPRFGPCGCPAPWSEVGL